MKRDFCFLRFVAVISLVGMGHQQVATAAIVQASGRQVLSGHIPAAVAQMRPLGRVAATNRLNLAIGLPLRDQDDLKNLIAEISNPSSPNFRHYLTPDQFTETYGPTEQDYQAVIAFAKSNGLAVTMTHQNRLLLNVSGSVTDVERVFHVTMHNYWHPKEARTFFAPDVEPSLDLAVQVLHVDGLNNYYRPHPRYHVKRILTNEVSDASPKLGAGPGGTYMGNDFRSAYVPGVVMTGTGQTVGLLQFDGYTPADIAYYANKAGITNPPPLTNVLLDGFNGVPTGNGGEGEVSLDIEMVMSMAPGVAGIIVYEDNPYNGNPNTMLNRMATDNLAKQIGCSWGWGGGADAVADGIFLQMAAQGQTFYNASGDSDAFYANDPMYLFPSGEPNITEVGGTTLSTAGAGGAWLSETVWNWGGGEGSSGGIAPDYAIPGYQQGLSMAANLGSTSQRNIPDVAMVGDNVYVRADGQDQDVGGTSCAAPLWAAFTALVNQQAALQGRPTVGFVCPAIYTIGKSSLFATTFHDTTTGNNFSPNSPAKFPAVTGYDLCTGWGSPGGQSLIDALAGATFIVITTNFLTWEGCTPTNGVIDPGETVTMNYALRNAGVKNATNLVVTLVTNSEVSNVSAPWIYGFLMTNGPSVTGSFSFTAGGTCGGYITNDFTLRDGTNDLGKLSAIFRLGYLTQDFMDGFDLPVAPALPDGWTTISSGLQPPWKSSTYQADSRPNCLFTPDNNGVGENSIVSPLLYVYSPSEQLVFRHRYNLQGNAFGTIGYDGGVLEIKIGSANFVDITDTNYGGSFASGGYNRILTSRFGNPLGDRAAWSGNSGGYITTVVNLPPIAVGQFVQFRWRCGTDDITGSSGWRIGGVSLGHIVCCGDPAADLAIGLTTSPHTAVAGQPLTYLITVTNKGPAAADYVTLNDKLPAAATLASAAPSQGTFTNVGSTVFCALGTIPAGGVATASFVILAPNPPAATNGLLTNSASTASTYFDATNADNSLSIITPVWRDSVGDGIPDWWRSQNFGGSGTSTTTNNCAACDPDKDGQSNLQEFLADTQPTNASSLLKIVAISNRPPNTMTFFPSSTGRVYSLESTTNAIVGPWSPVGGQSGIYGSGSITNLPDTNSPAATFYRIKATLP